MSERIVFDALWTGVVNDWETDERHTKFLDQVRATGAFTERRGLAHRQVRKVKG